jgi:hypothetical protein
MPKGRCGLSARFPGRICRVTGSTTAGTGIVAGIFGVLGFVVVAIEAWDFWSGLFTLNPGVLIGVGLALALGVGITLYTRHDSEGTLVFRAELREDPIPAPHTSSMPPVVSLYSRGFVISDDGVVRPGGRLPRSVDLRRRRLDLRTLSRQLVDAGLAPPPANPTTPARVIEADGYRYTHRFDSDVDAAAVAELLRDPAWLARCRVRKDRPYREQRHIVRLSPTPDAVPGTEQKWNGAVPPREFGHPLDEPTVGARCGVAAELAGHSWLTSVLNDPERAWFRDPDGTLYFATGRPFLPDEPGCGNLGTDGRL